MAVLLDPRGWWSLISPWTTQTFFLTKYLKSLFYDRMTFPSKKGRKFTVCYLHPNQYTSFAFSSMCHTLLQPHFDRTLGKNGAHHHCPPLYQITHDGPTHGLQHFSGMTFFLLPFLLKLSHWSLWAWKFHLEIVSSFVKSLEGTPTQHNYCCAHILLIVYQIQFGIITLHPGGKTWK